MTAEETREAEVVRTWNTRGFPEALVLTPDGQQFAAFVENGVEEGDTVQWRVSDGVDDAEVPAKKIRERTGGRAGATTPPKKVKSLGEAVNDPKEELFEIGWEDLL